MLFQAALQRKTVNLLGKLNVPHTFTYVKDFGKALAIAGTDERAIGKVWHVPSGKAYTQGEIIGKLSYLLGYEVKIRTNGKLMLSLIGLFNKKVKEVVEMLYEFEEPFIMSASEMEKEFNFSATPMEQRLQETLDWVKNRL
jgi:nucleoside-diphosphate-sugar epimerase